MKKSIGTRQPLPNRRLNQTREIKWLSPRNPDGQAAKVDVAGSIMFRKSMISALSVALIVVAPAASAYTSSTCPNQEPASQHMLNSMSYSANNPDVGELHRQRLNVVVQGITYTTSMSAEEYHLHTLIPFSLGHGGTGLTVEKRNVITTTINGTDGSVVITETYGNHNVVTYYQNGTTVSYAKGSNTKTTSTHNWGPIKSGNADQKVTNGWVSLKSIFSIIKG